MGDFCKQRVCVKLCCKLRKTFSQNFESQNKRLETKPRVEHKPVNGADDLKRAELQLRAINIQDELQTSKMNLHGYTVHQLYQTFYRTTNAHVEFIKTN